MVGYLPFKICDNVLSKILIDCHHQHPYELLSLPQKLFFLW